MHPSARTPQPRSSATACSPEAALLPNTATTWSRRTSCPGVETTVLRAPLQLCIPPTPPPPIILLWAYSGALPAAQSPVQSHFHVQQSRIAMPFHVHSISLGASVTWGTLTRRRFTWLEQWNRTPFAISAYACSSVTSLVNSQRRLRCRSCNPRARATLHPRCWRRADADQLHNTRSNVGSVGWKPPL